MTGFVITAGFHTFNVSHIIAKGRSHFIIGEIYPHARFEAFEKIQDATLYLFSKFAKHEENEENRNASHYQVSYCLVNTSSAFPNSVEMGKYLIQSRNNIISKWNALYSTRPKRNSRNRAPVNYSDDKPVETPPI